MPATVRNVAREKLEQGQLSLGVGVRMTRSVEIAKAMAVAGFDWLFLDMEHGVMSLEACAQISTAALDAGIAPIARVPNGEYAIATRALDNGALGIVMPHVDSAAEAREVVNRSNTRRSAIARWVASDRIMVCARPVRRKPPRRSMPPT